MIEINQQDRSIEAYRKVLKILESNLKTIELSGGGVEVLTSYKRLLAYLRTRSPEKIKEILGQHPKTQRLEPEKIPLPPDEEIRSMNVERVRQLISKEGISRKHLEQIATVRFGVTKGALSTLRARRPLIEKIQSMISNESTHESIVRVAGSTTSENK